MKFAHIADCHIGGWRDPKLRELSIEAFRTAVNTCIEKNIDFLLIAGDLFNNSLPALDMLKSTVTILQKLKQNNIPVYIIPGSHDFSPSGKTMLEVLEEAHLVKNVVRADKELTQKHGKLVLKFTEDEKTGAKIAGLLGRKGMLEKYHYEDLYHENLINEEGFKIFMFHTALTELKPLELEKMESCPVSMLPKTFNYYAGGHVHIVDHASLEGYDNIVYPGPLFPNNFYELEKLGAGGFSIYENENIHYMPIKLKETSGIILDCNHLDPEKVETKLNKDIEDKDFTDMIVMIKLFGKLETGKVSNIGFKDIFNKLYDKGAYFVMKNTSSLLTKEFEEVRISSGSIEELENNLIHEQAEQMQLKGMDLQKQIEFTKNLIHNLHTEKQEGERVSDFEDRLCNEICTLLGI